MSANHGGHRHGMAKQTLRLAFFLTIIIIVAEVAGGILAHSLALLSDAGHALTDIFALGLAWFATAQAERPANARKTFGYHVWGITSGMAHVWGITSGMAALSCHVLIDDALISESSAILQALETMLSEKYGIGHSTIQFECHAHQEQYCSVDGLYCQMEALPEAEHEHKPTTSTTQGQKAHQKG